MRPSFANSFGEYLVNRRRAAGWSQEELAERSTVSVRTIRNLETGSIKRPRKSSVDLLLEAFRETLGPTGPAQPQSAAAEFVRTRPSWRGTRGDPEPIVGRRADLDHIRDGVRRERRMVLTGPGGVGKSRLALAAAAELRVDYPDGAAVVEAGVLPPERTDPARSLDLLRHAVLAALGAPDRPDGGWPAHHVRMLLVIDNVEHLTHATTRVSQLLMDTYPGVHLLVTSRRPIPAASAPVWEVGPLAVDGGWRPEAAELLLRRTKSACPTLDLDDRPDAVRELCARLDGMPFALELAALRLRSVPIDKLLRDGPIPQILGQAAPVGLPHQRTLADSVRWSYDLLAEKQRVLLRRLATLAGPFTVEDVERLHLCSATGTSDAVHQLAELVDSSLVQVQRGAHYVYRLLGYVREFVLNRPDGHLPRAPYPRGPRGAASAAPRAPYHKSNVVVCDDSSCPSGLLTVPLDCADQPGAAWDAGSA